MKFQSIFRADYEKKKKPFKDDPAFLAQHGRACQYLVWPPCASHFMYPAFLFRPSI